MKTLVVSSCNGPLMGVKPQQVHLHRHSGVLEIHFQHQECYHLSAEYLRVHSPSAEVRGHGQGPGILVSGKRLVKITHLTPVGHYGVQIHFDDQHQSGIYSWPYLQQLGKHHNQYWSSYLQKLEVAKQSRDADTHTIRILSP